MRNEPLNEAGERWDDDRGLDLRAQPTAGADGRYCQHHDDDPAHTGECYQLPEQRGPLDDIATRIAATIRDPLGAQDVLRDQLLEFAGEIKRQSIEP